MHGGRCIGFEILLTSSAILHPMFRREKCCIQYEVSSIQARLKKVSRVGSVNLLCLLDSFRPHNL
jgi:hypothetical protein